LYQETKTTTIMEKTVYLVHACDDWGAHIGIAGIYTKKSIAIKHILSDYRNNYNFTDEQLEEVEFQLNEYNQTQGIPNADNYDIEVKTLDEWDW
jgi:hypothetical protein